MRHILVLLAVAGLAAPAFAAEPEQTREQQVRAKAEALARCQYRPERAVNREIPIAPKRLAEAPPARMELAVNRTVGGCPVPVIVLHDVELRAR
jgi:hypothetical protein